MKAPAGLVLAGDWNAELGKDTGTHSPKWLADQAGLELVGAGPGRHGNIDYVAYVGALKVTSLGRGGNGSVGGTDFGSDHDMILMRVKGPSVEDNLRLLTWNVERDRPVGRVVAQIAASISKHAPDVVVLQECAQYVDLIRLRLGKRWHIVTGKTFPTSQNVILVSKALGHTISGVRVVQLSPDGWTTVEGKEHAPVYAPSVVVDGWCRFVGVHMPPSVNWKGWLIYGPPRRVAVYVASIRKLRSWVHHWKASQ